MSLAALSASRRSLAWFSLITLLSLLLLGCGGQSSNPTTSSDLDHPSFLWEVHKGESKAWLFGTMHVADPRVTTLALEVEQAFDAADMIITEIESTPAVGIHMAREGALSDGQTLSDILPKELYIGINDYLVSRKFNRGIFDKLQPWMVTLQLGMLDAIPYSRFGDALDTQLMKNARLAGKEFAGLETVEEQIAALSSNTRADQIHLLDIALQSLVEEQQNGVVGMHRLLDLYVAGDANAMWEFALSETDFDDPIQVRALNALLTDRNLRMAQRIHNHLQENPKTATFFAFGALHFVGPDSVVERLRALGYEVTRVTHTPRPTSTQ